MLQEELPYDAELLSSHGVFALFSKAVYATITDGNTCVLFHGVPSAAYKIGAHVMALLALLLFKFSYADKLLHRLHDDKKLCTFTFTASLVFIFTPHLYTLGVIVGFLIVASIYYPSSRIIFKAQCPDSGRHLAQCPEDIVNFYF